MVKFSIIGNRSALVYRSRLTSTVIAQFCFEMIVKLIILNLLTTICAEYQEMELIEQLNNFFHFDLNVFVVDSSIDRNRFIAGSQGPKYVPQILCVFKSSNDISAFPTVQKLNSKNPFFIVIPKTSDFQINTRLLRRLRLLRRQNMNMKMGVFFSQVANDDDIEQLFKWCWSLRIVYVFVAVTAQSTTSTFLNIFTFNSFGKTDAVNVTGKPLNNIFLNQYSNLKEHEFQVAGTSSNIMNEMLWSVIFRVVNAKVVRFNGTRHFDKELWPNESLDIDIAGRVANAETTEHMEKYLYPIKWDSTYILVPKSLPYSEFLAYLQAIISESFFCYSLTTVVIVILLLVFFRYIKQKEILVFESTRDVLYLLMNDNGTIKYQKLSRIEGSLIVSLTLGGFVVVNVIWSMLQSYLTQPVFQPEINTIEDIYRSNMNILTWADSWKKIVHTVVQNRAPHDDWRDRILVVDINVIRTRRAKIDTSMLFLCDLDSALTVFRNQELLKKRGYRICRECEIFTQLAAHRVNEGFPFMDRFNDVIHRMQSAGLYQKWKRDYFEKVTLKFVEETYLENVSFPISIVYGWFASIILFMCEIIWKNFRISHIKTFSTSKIRIAWSLKRFKFWKRGFKP